MLLKDRFSVRQLVFLLLVFGMTGLVVELLLMKHYESVTQLIPLVMLGAGLASAASVVLRPAVGTLRAFRVLMILFVVSGLLGLYYHYTGNVEFALERDGTLHGFSLVWKALRGATPALAPGALAQLGLLGLIYSYQTSKELRP